MPNFGAPGPKLLPVALANGSWRQNIERTTAANPSPNPAGLFPRTERRPRENHDRSIQAAATAHGSGRERKSLWSCSREPRRQGRSQLGLGSAGGAGLLQPRQLRKPATVRVPERRGKGDSSTDFSAGEKCHSGETPARTACPRESGSSLLSLAFLSLAPSPVLAEANVKSPGKDTLRAQRSLEAPWANDASWMTAAARICF